MKNQGVSLISLVITVVVIIIIASIVAYNGIDMIDDVRKKDAEDKLKVIGGAILKDDTFLDFDENTEILLTESDFDYMDLLKYYDSNNEVKVIKGETNIDDTKKISYTLVMKNLDSLEEHSYTFDYNLHTSKYNYDISFDESKKVNRPIITKDMKALMPDGVTEVDDIYTTNWYNYEKGRANFAKMEYDGKIYVWIPRFAYDIQNFYEGRPSSDVPSTAISIVFLRETSSYMKNDETMQGEYKVHPAFMQNDMQLSGVWVEQTNTTKKGRLPNYPLYESNDEYNLHMMTNMECGAAIYLMYALEEMDQIVLDADEYVAACADGLGVFSNSDGYVTPYVLDESGNTKIGGTYGDSLYETPWNRVIDSYPTTDKRYLIRKFGSSLFDFTKSDGTDSATYRGVIVVK